MPPSSRRRARRDAEPQQSDADTAAMETPSRKRRKVINASKRTSNGSTATTRQQTKREEAAHSDETVENEEVDYTAEQADADVYIQKLKTAHYSVNAATDFHNSIMPRATAMAKLAGKDWTYYVQKPRVIIGRPQKKALVNTEIDNTVNPASTTSESFRVDIDLGPELLVSRVHAEIHWDPDTDRWLIHVNGRNGVIVDDTKIDRNKDAYLRSGSVISILGTEMMFLTPQAPLEVPASMQMRVSQGEFSERSDGEYDGTNQQPKSSAPQTSGPRGGRVGNSQQALQSQFQGSTRQTFGQQTLQPPLPGTPSSKRGKEPAAKTKTAPSPAYGRGLLLESTEDINYSLDSSKDIKPPHSYAQLIGQAILSSPEEKATLSKIYDFIKENYAFYRYQGGGWQNSIRHNLSLSKCFEKIPRRTDEPGKGMKWQIVPEHREEFLQKKLGNVRRGARRPGSSGPNSPAAATERLMSVVGASSSKASAPTKTSPREATPPLASYPVANESYTPDRGPRPSHIQTTNLPAINGGPNSDNVTPTYARLSASATTPAAGSSGGRNPLNDHAALNSPPTLTSSMGHDLAMQTPLIARQYPRLAPPSTARLPSQFMAYSSPAPFFKYMDFGSTPARPAYDLSESPAKRNAPLHSDDHEAENNPENVDAKERVEADVETEATEAQPSSPPALNLGKDAIGSDKSASASKESLPMAVEQPPASLNVDAEEGDGDTEEDMSPSRTISRPGTRQGALAGPPPKRPLGLVAPNASFPLSAPQQQQQQRPIGLGMGIGLGVGMGVGGAMPIDEGEEEEGIDLAKGFKSIGSFHRELAAGNGIRMA